MTHLEVCEACRNTFDRLAAGTRWWSDLRQYVRPGTRPDPLSSPTLTMDGSRRSQPGGATEAGQPDEELPLDFLGPPETLGHLGRFGPYEVLELFGRGGMGIVLKAFDPTLHRLVAIKVLAPQLATSASARRRFTREARAAASVVHDHVVTIHAVDEANGLPYLVMQYIKGVSLQERLDRDGPLETREILRIGIQAAQGLAAAHAQGLVHRDVKPSNILLENGVERVKLTDFGLARAADDASLTQSGVVAGTPQYMAPEQARGESLDHRADLFSLGSVLYAMSTGRSPFRAETSVAVLKRVCEDTPRAIREVNSEIPEWLAAIVARLHAKEPAERYQSAAEVADVLGRHLSHLQQPIGSPTPGQDALWEVGATKRPRQRSSRGLRVVAAAALVLLGGLGLSEATGVTQVSAYLATVLRIPVRDGTLVVEVDDPGISVEVDGEAVAIKGAGPKAIRLNPGSHRVRAERDGVSILGRPILIRRGDRTIVSARLEASAPRGKPLPDPNRSGGPEAASTRRGTDDRRDP